jgi:tripartite-type tricarboxylate transporter receptor subunit TctC
MPGIGRIAVAALLGLAAAAAAAQGYPSKPIRFVVPFPGGFADVLARQLGAKLADPLGQPVVVEGKPGGSGQIGVQEVLRAPADGHVLFMGHIGTHAINPHIFAKLAYDPERDLAPVTLLVTVPNLLVVHPSVPAQTVQELVAYARKNPGRLSYASPGNGTSGHLAAELFKSTAGLFIVHIPYRGAAPALQDVMAGEVQLIFDTFAQSLPQAKAGKVRALAVTSLKRQASAPEIPTMDESGFPGWETGPWFGVMVRAGTPDAIVKRLNAALVRALQSPDVRDKLVAQGVVPVGNTPEEFAAFIRAESARWAKVVKAAGIKAD